MTNKHKPRRAPRRSIPMHKTRWTDKGLYCLDCRDHVNPEKGSRPSN